MSTMCLRVAASRPPACAVLTSATTNPTSRWRAMPDMRSGSFAIILDAAGAVLLCHRTDIDLWNLPGGGVEDGESPWDAAVRETREEVGLEIEIDRLAGVYFKPEVTEIVFSFVARIVGGSPRTSEEADDVRYFPLDAIPANT